MGVDHTIFFGPFAECSWTGKPAHTKNIFVPAMPHTELALVTSFARLAGLQ